ncbi:hypothetical protein QTN25_006177 [Entamoeba marina]
MDDPNIIPLDYFDTFIKCLQLLSRFAIPAPLDLFTTSSVVNDQEIPSILSRKDVNRIRDVLFHMFNKLFPLFPEMYNYNALLIILKNKPLTQMHQLRALIYFLPPPQKNALIEFISYAHLSNIPTTEIAKTCVPYIFKIHEKYSARYEVILTILIDNFNFMTFQLNQPVSSNSTQYQLKARTISAFPLEPTQGYLHVPDNVVVDIDSMNSVDWVSAIHRDNSHDNTTESREEFGFIPLTFLKLIPEKFTLPLRELNRHDSSLEPYVPISNPKRSNVRQTRQIGSEQITNKCPLCFKSPIENPACCEHCPDDVIGDCCYECLKSITVLKDSACPLCGHSLTRETCIIPTTQVVLEKKKTPSTSPLMERKWKNDYKISIVGKPGVGKTSLLIHFVFGKFIIQTDTTITDIFLKTIIISDVPCMLKIFDFREKSVDGYVLIYKDNDIDSKTYVEEVAEQLQSKFKKFVVVRNDFDNGSATVDDEICKHSVFHFNGKESVTVFSDALRELITDIRATEARPHKPTKCTVV